MLNIVVPMAGAGSRFAAEGYTDPKPLIKVNGVPMIRVVIRNLTPKTKHRFIFICQNEHIEKYNLCSHLEAWAPGCQVVGIDGLTEGAACTVMAAKALIADSNALMIANSDQYVDIDINNYLRNMEDRHLDGLIMTMSAADPKWSYVSIDESGFVNKVVEKKVISNEATVGIYNYARGKDFVDGAELMFDAGDTVNGEYYVAPVYNYLKQLGVRTGVYNIGAEGKGMHGLGIPSDLKLFLNNPIHVHATDC